MIYEVARIINRNGLDTSHLNLKLVKGTSEKIHEHYHDEVQKAFGQKMVSEYGAAEAGIIAFECPSGSMHLNMEGCIVEEEDGEILVTNLNAYSFPIIRYKLGDSIVLEDEQFECPCGMNHRVLREVTGRVGKRVFGKSKTYPSLVFYYVFKNLYLDAGISVNGQFVQKKKGHLLMKVEQVLTNEIRARINAELESYFGADMAWELEESAVVHTMDGKRKDFISEVD
jgi:phenylacetate-CoA ligase